MLQQISNKLYFKILTECYNKFLLFYIFAVQDSANNVGKYKVDSNQKTSASNDMQGLSKKRPKSSWRSFDLENIPKKKKKITDDKNIKSPGTSENSLDKSTDSITKVYMLFSYEGHRGQ